MSDEFLNQLPKAAQDEIQKQASRPVVLSIGVLFTILGSAYGYGQTTQRITALERDNDKAESIQRRAYELFDERLRNIEIYSGVPPQKRRPSIEQEIYGDKKNER